MKTGMCVDCGQPCDHRAKRCTPCASRAKAAAQWADPAVRSRMEESLRAAHRKRRLTFADLSLDSNWQIKSDGRRYIWYWDGDRRRTIYRYQWVWIQAHGPIPPGIQIHHVSEDKADDRLENLQALTPTRHQQHHIKTRQSAMLKARGVEPLNGLTATCEQCQTEFKVTYRGKANRFCSQKCRIGSMQTTRICPTCGQTFIGGLDHGKPRKYCGRECFLKAHRSTI